MIELDCTDCPRPNMSELRATQQVVLECIARDQPLEGIMTKLCAHTERFAEEVYCAILAIDGDGRLHPIAAPSLPPDYFLALGGIKITQTGGAASPVPSTKRTDIDPLSVCAAFEALALPPGLQACRSSPILASTGRIVGMFAFYDKVQRGAGDFDRAVVKACVNLCAIAFEQAERKAHIQRLAYQDPVTGVANRVFFEARAAGALEAAIGRNTGVALHWIDLDRFKSLNDTLGHDAGDAVLREMATRIRETLKPDELLARIGGDEFAVLQSTDSVADVEDLGRRLVAVTAVPFRVDSGVASIGFSVGAARAPENGRDLKSLMRRADLALYQAKADGRGRFRLFDPKIEAKVVSVWQTEQDLKRALEAHEFELFFQPILELASDSVNGYEALIRWRRPGHGLLSPIQFLPIAERNGLINPIGGWVLEEACFLASRLPPSARIAVNLSALQLVKPGFALDVAKVLAASGLSPARLELEVTESTFLMEEECTYSCLREIRSLGVSIALDDFGTGCSALSHLRSFAVDRIKIDRSFVNDIDKSRSTASIVRGVIAIARDLGVRTTAEGVETHSQLRALKDFGCDEIQGYLISPPRPLGDYLSPATATACEALQRRQPVLSRLAQA